MIREELSGQNNRWNVGAGGDMPIGFGLSLAAYPVGYGTVCE